MLSLLSFLITNSLLAAGEGQLSQPPLVHDVALSADGALAGKLVDRSGVPLAAAPLQLLRDRQRIRSTETDADGRFLFQNLSGSLYQIVAPSQDSDLGQTLASGQAVRVWTPRAAPPCALSSILLVQDTSTSRGQSKPKFNGVGGGGAIVTVVLAAGIGYGIWELGPGS